MSEEFNVGVVGAGYVGLVTGACLAHVGHLVTVMDADAERVADLEQGKVPIYEPGLEELMAKAARRLRFTTELAQMVREADVIFIAVGTPQGEDGSADLSSVAAVARGIGRALAEAEQGAPAGRGQQEHGAGGQRGLRLHAHPGRIEEATAKERY